MKTNNSFELSKENKYKEKESELTLLAESIELNSECSRWSTIITLLISVTIASLIALLGSIYEFQEKSIIYIPELQYDTIDLKTDFITITGVAQAKYTAINDNLGKIEYTVISAPKKDTVTNISIKYRNVKHKSSIPLLQIVFTCTSLAGFIFTIFFYFIRTKAEEKLIETKNKLKEVGKSDK